MRLVPRNDLFSSLDFFDDSIFHNNIMKSDIYEKDGNYILEMDLPGFKKEDIKIDYDKCYLSVSATKESNDENSKYVKRERFYGEYKRTFYIGECDEKEIKANYNDGILIITYPKENKKETKKQINIDLECNILI